MVNNSFICPACNCNNFTVKSSYKAKSKLFEKRIIVQCEECDLLSIYPMPKENELREYYDTYWDDNTESTFTDLFVAQAEARYNFIKKHISTPNTKILDIGAGYGLIKNNFDEGVVYDAVEVDPLAIDYLENKIKPRKIFSELEEVNEKYDLIILSHILEHMTDPVDFLGKINERLGNGSLLFIEVPNKDYLYKNINDPHVLFFENFSLKNLVSSAGYNVINIHSCGRLISDMFSNQNQLLKTIKSFIRKILPKHQLSKIKDGRNKERKNNLIKYVNIYGEDRQWIRLLAEKSSSSAR